MLTVAAVALGSCGGGGDDRTSASDRAMRSATTASGTFFPDVSIPADAATKGMWSPSYNWPLNSIHSVLMPDGRVLTFGTNSDGTQTANFIFDVWDASGAPDTRHQTLSNTSGTDIFCSSTILLQDGNVLISGGDIWTGTSTTNTGNNNSNIFNGTTNSLTRGPNMSRNRWYATSTTLINGEIYVQGGSGGDRESVV